jgi:nitroreductase
MADSYRNRGNNARRGDWSTTTARAIQGKKREHLLPFLQRLVFFRC